jgi:hypothetical protein
VRVVENALLYTFHGISGEFRNATKAAEPLWSAVQAEAPEASAAAAADAAGGGPIEDAMDAAATLAHLLGGAAGPKRKAAALDQNLKRSKQAPVEPTTATPAPAAPASSAERLAVVQLLNTLYGRSSGS